MNTVVQPTSAKRVGVATVAIALAFLMLLSAGLVTWRLQSFELEMARARAERQVDRIANEVERAIALGVNPSDMGFLEPTLARLLAKDKTIVAAAVLDSTGERIFTAGSQNVASSIKGAWIRQASLKTGGVSEFSQPPTDWSAVSANDATGRAAATIWLAYDRSPIAARSKSTAITIVPYALGLLALATLLFAVVNWTWKSASQRAMLITGTIVGLLMVAPMINVARDVGKPIVEAQVGVSANELAENMAGDLKSASERGIPIAKLPGIDGVFATELRSAKEFSFLLLTGPQTVTISREGLTIPSNVSAATDFKNERFNSSAVSGVDGAKVIVGYERDNVSKKLWSLVTDLMFAVIIALVVVFEVGRGAVQMKEGDMREASLSKLRLFVFFTALSEELLRPFFAQFASELNSPIAGLTPAWLVALPVMTFMATLALAQPFAPGLAARFELRRAMTLSCIAGGIGLIFSGFVHDVVYLTILRGMSGVAYGFALIFAQIAILRLVRSKEERASAMAQYALAIVAGGIVGPALGSIAAEAFGYNVSLSICAVAMVTAAVLALRLPVVDGVANADEARRKGIVTAFVRQGRALAVVALAAIPARLAAAAVLLLLAPLYLIESGERTSVIGRVLPLYFLTFYLLTRWAAVASDRMGNRKAFVIVGALISAAACMALPLFGGVVGAAVCCAVLGIGQAIMNSPMIVLATDIATQDGHMKADEAIAAFRFLERVGSIAAAPLAAILVGAMGTFVSVIVIGCVIAFGAVVLAIVLMKHREVLHSAPDASLA
jgi:MFS family permease